MLQRLASIATGGGDLLQAEGDLLLTKLQRLGRWGVAMLLAAMMIMIGLLGLLVAAAATLGAEVGWIGALAIVAGVLVVAGAAAWLSARSRLHETMRREAMPVEVRRQAREARTRIVKGGNHNHTGADQRMEQNRTWKDKAARFVVEHPGVTAGGALIAIGLFGPGRTLRLVGRGMMLAGIASTLARQTDEHNPGPAGRPRVDKGSFPAVPAPRHRPETASVG